MSAGRRLRDRMNRALRDRKGAAEQRRTTEPPRPEEPPAPAAPAASPDTADAQALRRYRRALWWIEKIAFGSDQVSVAAVDHEFAQPRVAGIVQKLRRLDPMATFVEEVAKGAPVDRAQVETVRSLMRGLGDHRTARSFVVGMGQLPGGQPMRSIGMGQILYETGEFTEAWDHLRDVDADLLDRLVPVEAVTCGLVAGGAEGRALALEIGRRDPAERDTRTLIDLAGRFVAAGDAGLARELVDEARQRDGEDLAPVTSEALRNIQRWTHPEPEPATEAAVRIGVLDYYQPDLDFSSRNIGDYVQTLAMLGHVARFQNPRLSGRDGLGEFSTELQQGMRPDLRLEGPATDVELLPVSRDFSEGDRLPPDTWMLAFGWHMHPIFKMRFGLPYHPDINPIFVSFHLQWTGVHTPEAIEYLKQHGPIGCRDWTTVHLLLSVGVDAFFTGCLTSTVDGAFPEATPDELDRASKIGVIDLPNRPMHNAEREVEYVTHAEDGVRSADLATGLRKARDLLTDYRSSYVRIVTSRLHSYLPATSLGVPTRFVPGKESDIRFDGLLGMEPGKPEFVAMQDGIRDLVSGTLDKVLAGAAKPEVYAHWREVTAPLVAEAKERFAEQPVDRRTDFDVPAAVTAVRDSAVAMGPHDAVAEADVVDIAMSTDANFRHLLPVTVESVLANASGPVRLWVTARGIDEEYRAWFARTFPDLPVTFLGYDSVDYGEIARMIPHITVATMDRLLLPEVLPQLDRIAYIDIDTVTTGDVRELANIDLEGHPLAGRPGRQTALTVWRLAGDLLDPERAAELRRVIAQRHGFDYRHVNCGVLVLDLERMRSDRFVETFVPWAGTYGVNDQDIFNAYAGPGRVDLAPRWNALPILEDIKEPGIVHYAGAGKPWSDEIVPHGHLWHEIEHRVRDRAGHPPMP